MKNEIITDFLDLTGLTVFSSRKRHERVGKLLLKLDEIKVDMKNILKVHT